MNLAQAFAIEEAAEITPEQWESLKPRLRSPVDHVGLLAAEFWRGLGFGPWPSSSTPAAGRTSRLRQEGWPYRVITVLGAAPKPLDLEEIAERMALATDEQRARVKTALSQLIEMGLAAHGEGYGRKYWITMDGRREL